MKSLGLVRKLDDYKRVPIPKEIKEILNLKKGDSVEFFKCDEGVIIRKHNPSLKEWIMEGLNIWGICTFVMPLVLIIIIWLMFIIASILDGVDKLIKRIRR